MVDVRNKRCLHESCMKRPRFKVEGSEMAMYCKQHAGNVGGLVDVFSKRCLYDSCTKSSVFNFEGRTPAMYCKQHAEDGMVCVRGKHCLYKPCRRGPRFNFEGCKPAKYCKQHAEEGMVDVHTERSSNDTCTADVAAARRIPGPSNVEPTASARLAKEVLDDPMTSVGIEAPYEAAGCLKRSKWGVDGKQDIHCLDHASFKDGVMMHTAAVEMAPTKEASCSLPSLGLGTRSDGSGGRRTTPKRTRNRLYRRARPPQEMSIQLGSASNGWEDGAH